MDLFDYMKEQNLEQEAPLASRLRPSTLDEVVGQEHIIGKDKLLYRAIKADKLGSVIFYGPPGTGKTTLAKVIANTTSSRFRQINATVAGKKDMEEVVKEAQDYLGMYGKKTILFIDEIHRFNKGQQDYLLPFVEDGTLILIGATTENPYFEVNGALISRSIIFELKPLTKENIETLLDRAVTDKEKGMGSYNAVLEEDAREFLADISGGDARAALNALELGILTTKRREDGKIHIDLETASQCIQKRVVRYDKTGDNHYDTISAFIKSMRGSDPDAAVFYLAKMLYAGEDIKFIARRIMICAAEDVGNADPQALVVAVAAAQAVERLGQEVNRQKEKIRNLQQRYVDLCLEEAGNQAKTEPEKSILLFVEELDAAARRNFVNAAMDMTEGFAGVFVGNDEEGYQYVLGSRSQDIQEAGKQLNARFQGKGGGRPPMIQGSLHGEEQALKEFLS